MLDMSISNNKPIGLLLEIRKLCLFAQNRFFWYRRRMNKVETVSNSNLTLNEKMILMPRREYNEFSLWKKEIKVNLDEKWFWTLEWQKKEAEADQATKSGKIMGPFSNHKKLLSALRGKRK